MVWARKGALLEMDASLKQLLLDIDEKRARMKIPRLVIEDLDDTHVFVDITKVKKVEKKIKNTLESFVYRE